MREVDSQVLRSVAGALGIGNPVTAVDQVVFDDENLQQALDVSGLLRRGGTIQPSNGLFSFVIRNTHAGAGTIRSLRNPYNTSSAILTSGYTAPLPARLDAWLIALAAMSSGTASVFGGAFVGLGMIDAEMGFGDAVIAPAAIDLPIVTYDAEDATFNNSTGTFLSEAVQQLGRCPLPIRLRAPQSRIVWETVGTGAGGIYDLIGVVGVFPAGLGQDATR